MCFAVSVGANHINSTVSRLRRAVEKKEGVMRRMTSVVTMVARCRIDYDHVLTKNSAVIGAQLCQYSSCLPWQCIFG